MLGIQEQVRNSRDNRAISVRATEILLYETSVTLLISYATTLN